MGPRFREGDKGGLGATKGTQRPPSVPINDHWYYAKLSARSRHYARDEAALAAFKKSSRSA